MLSPSSNSRKRPYVLLPAGTERASAWPAGACAEPRFAVRVSWLELDTEAACEPISLAPSTHLPQFADDACVEVAPAPELSVSTPELDFATEPLASEPFTDSTQATPSPARRPTLHELAVAVVPSVVGAGLAWFVSGETSADPVTWTALGAAAGFLLGWGCLLWIRREG